MRRPGAGACPRAHLNSSSSTICSSQLSCSRYMSLPYVSRICTVVVVVMERVVCCCCCGGDGASEWCVVVLVCSVVAMVAWVAG